MKIINKDGNILTRPYLLHKYGGARIGWHGYGREAMMA
jgi:hypothetical protein